MAAWEASAIALVSAVVKSAAKLWLGDRRVAADVSASALDILQKQATGLNEKRRTRLLFENIEDRVAARMLPLLEVEFRTLEENEQQAAIDCVRKTFEQARLTHDDLFDADLDAGFLYRHLVHTFPGAPDRAFLAGAAEAFYHRVLRECCAYVIQLTSTLPGLQNEALPTLLRRETEILSAVQNVLTTLPASRSPEDFAADYRRQVVTTLDRMALYGAGLTRATRLYPLSVAYLSLSVTADPTTSSALRSADRIEEVLPHSNRILLRGEAGSGKTTLLQWIAVAAATGRLDETDTWAGLTPFLVRLRRYAEEDLPSPKRFLDVVGRHIADEMPPGWVTEQLRNGTAVLLIDGIDELPDKRRADVHEWLLQLVTTFPRARYVITTRPAAVPANWLGSEGFLEVSLQPMTPADVRTFVVRWHDAMPADHEALVDLDERRHSFLTTLGKRSALRRLAENPLLCALLCALHHENEGHLPENRMELYQVALKMLLDRRDAERKVNDGIKLAYRQKMALLSHIAYWLVRNGHSDAAYADVLRIIDNKLHAIGEVVEGTRAVYRYLLDRGGVLREPVPGRVDFLHRTFQEYLAAAAAMAEDDTGVLVDKAHLDDWREVVLLAVGHANNVQREHLLSALLTREADPQTRTKLDLLTVACLETSPELSKDVRAEIQRRMGALLPPQDFAAVTYLVSAGEYVTELLTNIAPTSTKSACAVVRTASLIGGPSALEVLSQLGTSCDTQVVDELVKAWQRFDWEQYARQVLARSPLVDGHLNITSPDQVTGLEHLEHLSSLSCRFEHERSYGRLDFVPRLHRLRHLYVRDNGGYDLTSLAGTTVTHLTITGIVPPDRLDLSPLASVDWLRSLRAAGPTSGWAELATLPWLNSLALNWVLRRDRLVALSGLPDLQELELGHVHDLVNLAPLFFLNRPRTLTLRNCDRLRDIRGLSHWSGTLRTLSLVSCPKADLNGLASLHSLKQLEVSGNPVADLEWAKGLDSLDSLALREVESLPSLEPLRFLRHLRALDLRGSGQVYLGKLAERADIVVHVDNWQKVIGVSTTTAPPRVIRH
ncbi:NACHT domain-containing protein [Amycolatopsis sp. NBC_00345]|uniref:NACHT domain-containing protein n=1 Tax=Amycolatopsis sp. NBC_00345 TaxID=2975955 RepID=UPI002E25CD3B